MNRHLIFILLLVFSGYSYAQNCNPATTYSTLQANDIRATFSSGGSMFHTNDLYASFAVPYEAGHPTTHSLFAGALWLGAFDQSNEVLVAANAYGNGDYWAGPINPTMGIPDEDACSNFDKIWTVKRWEIEAHIADFTDNGTINNTPSATILGWPARGNAQFTSQHNFELPDQDLAPFFDRNSNGVYEPLLGDYPVFEHNNETAIAEEIFWYVFNDNGGVHDFSGTAALRMEIQVTAYGFYCENDPLINQSLFVKHKIINRNTTTLYGFKAGLWLDGDLGCFDDDMMGSAPDLNSIYFYNGSNNDGEICNSGGLNGYGENPPIQAITMFNQSLKNSMYTTSSSDPQHSPGSGIGFYRLLDGIWPNGIPLTTGEDGYDLVGTDFADFAFPDNPNDPNGWSMVTEYNSNDYRAIGSTGKDTLAPGEIFELDVVYSFHRDTDSTNLQNINLMYNQIPLLQQFYDGGYDLSGCTQKATCLADCVYPGDMNNNGIANDFDILDWGVAVGQSTMAAARSQATDDWWPYELPNPTTNGHLDANGDGAINLLDFETNTQNWGRMHPLYDGLMEGSSRVGNDLFFERYFYNTGFPYEDFGFPALDTIVNIGEHASLELMLGDSVTNEITDIYGLTFQIEYDATVLEMGSDFPGWSFEIDGGWLYELTTSQNRRMDETGTTHFVIVRTDGTPVSGAGQIGQIAFSVRPDAPLTASVMSTEVCFSNVKAVDENGNDLDLRSSCIEIQYKDSLVSSVRNIEQPTTILNAQLAPNPTSENTLLSIDLREAQNIKIQLVDITGKMIQPTIYHNGQQGAQFIPLETNMLAQGVYFCRIYTNGQMQSIKLIKL